MTALPHVDIVVPFFNEGELVLRFHQQLTQTIDPLPYQFRLIYVNDGSVDRTGDFLQRLLDQDERITIVELSRNFGHQAALTAGLDQSQGDYVISMDGDGQHPPALIAEMLRLAEMGYDLVLTQREENAAMNFKRWTSEKFYQFINRIGDTKIIPGSADFDLMSATARLALGSMREYHRFLRGMVSWIGFKTAVLPYVQPERLEGKSKYSLRKMLRLASDAIFSFSLVPLYIGITLGVVMLGMAVAEFIYVLSFWVSGNYHTLSPGWSSLMFILLVIGGFLMILMGFIGIYVGNIFQEVKRRPIYLIKRTAGIQQADSGEPPAQSRWFYE